MDPQGIGSYSKTDEQTSGNLLFDVYEKISGLPKGGVRANEGRYEWGCDTGEGLIDAISTLTVQYHDTPREMSLRLCANSKDRL